MGFLDKLIKGAEEVGKRLSPTRAFDSLGKPEQNYADIITIAEIIITQNRVPSLSEVTTPLRREASARAVMQKLATGSRVELISAINHMLATAEQKGHKINRDNPLEGLGEHPRIFQTHNSGKKSR